MNANKMSTQDVDFSVSTGWALTALLQGNGTWTAVSGFVRNNVGIAGGTVLVGGTVASENLTLSSTSNATKGSILFGNSAYVESSNFLGIGTTTPGFLFTIRRAVNDFLFEMDILNNSPGNSAATAIRLNNDVGSNIQLGVLGSGNTVYSTYGSVSDGFMRFNAGDSNFNFILNPISTPNKAFRFYNETAVTSTPVFSIYRNGVGIGVSTPLSRLDIVGSTTARAQINLATGAAPATPNDGDIWRENNTDTGLKIRVNSVTKTITLI